ncbi:alpha-1B-glycoprotein-like [Eretmochelys imbricata]
MSHAVSPGLRGNSGHLWKGIQEPVPRATGSDPPWRPCEPSYPKPSISLSPSWGVSLGGAVAVWCWGQHRGVRFVLNKEGRRFQTVASKGLEAVFPISNVRREDRGSYSCSYQNRLEPFAVSSPSDPVELAVRDPSLPRPSVSLSPTGVTAPGADVTIRCWGQRQDVRFFLHKAGDLNPPRHMDPAGDGAEFRIPTVGRQHGGSYSCSYRPPSEPFVSSQPSHPVQLVVAETSYPKPSISLSPSGGVSLGGAVAVWCRGQHRGVRFVLNKEGRRFQTVASKGLEAVFPISNVRREDRGSYSCSYQNRLEPFAVSSPSDPVDLAVRDPSLPRPSISLSPTGVTAPGADVTIRCQGQSRDVRFFLHKAGDLNPPRHMDPAGDGAEFHIPTVGRQNGGNYSCSYRPRSDPFNSSEPSDPVQLVVAEPSYPKPSISLSPNGGVTLGEAVTIQCWAPFQNVRFLLYKDGNPNTQQDTEPAGNVAEFSIRNVSRRDAGSYSCYYQRKWYQSMWSQPSDPVELVVAEPSYPKPNISLHPSEGVTLGGAVTVRCECRCRGARFFLRKAGHPDRQLRTVPDGTVAEFPIPSVGWEDGGTYTCDYRSITDQNRCSYPSDPVEIIVGEPSYPKPSISLNPSGGVSLGGAVAVWCRGQRQGVRFVLNKEGRHFPAVDSSGFGAVFFISNVSREHGGSYSCSYHSRSEPFAASSPSDPVELVVRDPSLPRPSISLSPTGVTAPGADVTIRCRGQRRDVRFFLHKAGDLNPPRHMDPAGDGAEFHIPTVGRQHGGSYSCSYRPRSEPFVSSQPSHPVELVVADPTLPKPSVSVRPSRGFATQEPVAMSYPSDPSLLGVRDYTGGNIVRLALSAGVLLALVLILAKAAHSWRRGGRLAASALGKGSGVTLTPSDVTLHRQDGAGRTSAAESV